MTDSIHYKVARYGVAFASKELGVFPVEVNFVSSDLLGQTTITAMFIPKNNIILFNSDWLDDAKPEEILLTAFHEARHAYQLNQIEAMKVENNKEPSDLIRRWKSEFSFYHRSLDSRTDDPRYLGQEIEIDAREFAQELLGGLFDLDPTQ